MLMAMMRTMMIIIMMVKKVNNDINDNDRGKQKIGNGDNDDDDCDKKKNDHNNDNDIDTCDASSTTLLYVQNFIEDASSAGVHRNSMKDDNSWHHQCKLPNMPQTTIPCQTKS